MAPASERRILPVGPLSVVVHVFVHTSMNMIDGVVCGAPQVRALNDVTDANADRRQDFSPKSYDHSLHTLFHTSRTIRVPGIVGWSNRYKSMLAIQQPPQSLMDHPMASCGMGVHTIIVNGV
jgi:hypothetical protein